MGADRKGSRSGGYVGGFLQLFDWNAKSRKKLFSSKSDLPEQCKQKKTCDGHLLVTRIAMMEEDETVSGSIVNGGSDYSYASSVTDEDLYKPPGVVARLMGLDSLPTSNYAEAYSTPFSDTRSLGDFGYGSRNLRSHHDHIPFSGNLCDKTEAPVKNTVEPPHERPISRPIEKFQTEVLPPKSAKSIPITQHKLLSPIKSSNFVPSKDAAQIMEVAARILDPGPPVTARAKISIDGSSTSSVPLKLRELKEKVQATQKPLRLAESSRRPGESTAAKYLKGQSLSKSSNGSADATPVRVSSDSDECSTSMQKKGKSVSLALQAKANVQKRERLNMSSGINVLAQKGSTDVVSNQLVRNRSSTQKSGEKKSSAKGASNLRRQNNQKQNRSPDIRKSPSKRIATNLPGGKDGEEFPFAQQRSSTKMSGNCKAGSRREGLYSSTKNSSRKKRCIDGDFQGKKNSGADYTSVEKGRQVVQSDSIVEPQHRKTSTTDIVSFTFNAPMMRSTPVFQTSREGRSSTAEYRCKQLLQGFDGSQSSNLSPVSESVLGGDALSTLLDQKLRELTRVVEAARHKPQRAGTSASVSPHLMPCSSNATTSVTLQSNRSQDPMHTKGPFSQWAAGISSTDFHGLAMKHGNHEMEGVEYSYDRNDTEAGHMLDHQIPSPISILESSLFTESCSSSDMADAGKLGSSVQSREVPGTASLKRLYPAEADAELSDSASSTYAKPFARKHVSASYGVCIGQSAEWELDYVKEILSTVELMFKDFAMGRARDIINPHLFEQLEVKKGIIRTHGREPKLRRKVLFDCVSECLDSRCRRYAGGGREAWRKGLSVVRQKERLAEQVYREISRWRSMRNCIVDELVDMDMSCSQYSRWLDFEPEEFEFGLQIENRLMNSLIDEAVADMLIL